MPPDFCHIRWRDAAGWRHTSIAGKPALAVQLAAELPDASLHDDTDSDLVEIIAERGAAARMPDEAFANLRRAILLDPTDADQLTLTRVLAGHTESRLVTVPSLEAIATAEHAFLLMLALTRYLLPAYSELVSGTRRPGARSLLTDTDVYEPNWVDIDQPVPLYDRTLGILGMGRTGEALAARARAFGMRVIYHDLEPKPGAEARWGVIRRRFDQVLRESDVVSLHLPLTPDTSRIIDAPELALMRESAILINTAHGRLVDEGSLMKALRLGDIAGAGLDVFAYEPIPLNSPLLGFDNVVLTPHIARATPEQERRHQLTRIVDALTRFGPPTRAERNG